MRQTSTKVHFSTSILRKEQEPCCRTEDASRRLSCLFLHVLGALLQWCSPRGSLAWDCLEAVFCMSRFWICLVILVPWLSSVSNLTLQPHRYCLVLASVSFLVSKMINWT